MIFDSNIVLHLLDEPPGSPLAEAIDALRSENAIRITPIILAEISPRFAAADLLLEACASLGLTIEPLTFADCHRAGQAFREHRRRGGHKQTILPNFLIGAQAELRGWPLVTRDRKGFQSYFPDLTIIDPTENL